MITNKKWKSVVESIVFVGPALIFFSVIVIIPFLMSIYYSFTSWNGISGTVEWIGLDNFKRIFTNDPQFFASFWFTVRFTVASVIVSNVIGFGLALMLTHMLKTRNLLRTAFFIPNVIGGLLLGFIWQFIFIRGFSSLGQLTNIPLFKLPWLGDETTAFWGAVIVFAWQVSGYIMVIYIAAIQNIDNSLLEAAQMDGSSGFHLLRKIIIPLVTPAFTICLFLTISMSFKIFDTIISLTGGGPFNSTQAVAINIYHEAFTNNRMGLGTAKALIFFIVVALITTIQVMITKKREVQA
jgi:raffinose/stachyose/melibiose transport system permease protein